jgi:hypothetical protein
MSRHQRRQAKAKTRKPLPGYQHRLLAVAPDLATMRGVSHAMVLHDDGCAIFQRQACTCTPDISIVNGGSVVVIDERGQTHKSSRQ